MRKHWQLATQFAEKGVGVERGSTPFSAKVKWFHSLFRLFPGSFWAKIILRGSFLDCQLMSRRCGRPDAMRGTCKDQINNTMYTLWMGTGLVAAGLPHRAQLCKGPNH